MRHPVAFISGRIMADRDITELIADIRRGDDEAAADLFRRVYRELRQLAAHYMRRERQDHTLQATALVHEAYLRMLKERDVSYENRAHFFGIAANVMRRILVDHARAHRAEKRGGHDIKVPLEDAPAIAIENCDYIIEVDRALERLAALDARQARIVELRFFAGLSVEQTADIVGVTPRTIVREWRVARGWLQRELAAQT
jgi:RNA polymerase sigma factor (TIGR02999 family)